MGAMARICNVLSCDIGDVMEVILCESWNKQEMEIS